MSAFDLTFTVLNFILGGTLFFLGVTVLRDDFGNRLNRTTALLFFSTALTPIFWSLGSVIQQYPNSSSPFQESLLYNLVYASELFFPALVVFALAFTARLTGRLHRRYLAYLIFIPQLLHLLTALVFNNIDALFEALVIEDSSGPIGGTLQSLFVWLQFRIFDIDAWMSGQGKVFPIINSLYGIGAIVIMVRGLSHAVNETFRKQSIVILVGLAIPSFYYTGVYAVNIIFDLGFSATLLTLAQSGAVLAFVYAFFWAIIRHQFLNIGLAVRQSLVYTISTGMLVGLYLFLFRVTNAWIESFTGGEGLALQIGFTVLALIFFQPLNSQVEELIRWLFLRSRADLRNLIETVSRQTISVFEPTSLRRIIEDNLRDHLMLDTVIFALFDDRVKEYTVLATEEFPHRYIIDRQDPYLGAIGQLTGPSPVEELAEYREDSQLAEELAERKTRMIVPLRDKDGMLGFISLPDKISGSTFTAEEINLLKVLSNQFVSALTNARLYAETVEKKRLEEELGMARQIQVGLLPRTLPSTNGFTIAAHSVPSLTIGGDFYDVFTLDDERDNERIAIVIADASGKGMPAAMIITQIQAMLRSEFNNKNSIQSALANVNNYIVNFTSAEKYATLFFGIYDSRSREFEYSNAGHNYPAVIRRDGSFEYLKTGGMIIGAFSGATYESASVILNPHDFIFLFTDGVSETMNADDEEYGEDRLLQFLLTQCGECPADVLNRTLLDVDKFYRVDPPQDDRTIVILQALGTNS